MKKLFDYSKVVFWLGLLFVLYMFAILTNETGKNYQLRSRADELDREIEQLRSQIEELGYKVTYYKTDSFQERLARDKLGLQKPGEQVVIVTKDSSGEKQLQVERIELKSPDELDSQKSNVQQWREFLLGRK